MSNNFHATINDIDEADDDKFRSRHLQYLIQKSHQGVLPDPSPSVPYTLIQYWDDSEVPSDVRRCLDSWRTLENLGFERQIFDRNSARVFIEQHFSDVHLHAFDSCTHPAMRSDYFRLCYLLLNGGLYVDADDELLEPEAIPPLIEAGLLQLQPLCYRLSTDSMVVPTDFAYEVGSDLRFYVANDPIISPAKHPVIEATLYRATNRLIAANGMSRDIQWLTGPGNLSETFVRHSLQLDKNGAQPDFRFIPSWVKVAPGDWTLDYRKDDRNWRLWVNGNVQQ